MEPISMQLTSENLREARRQKLVLGIYNFSYHNASLDEHFKFQSAEGLILNQSTKKSYALSGKAIGSYFLRRFGKPTKFHEIMNPQELELGKDRDGNIRGLRVYSNDVFCNSTSYNIPYPGTIVFQRNKMSDGVKELLGLIKEISPAGIISELSSNQFQELFDFIMEDIRTAKHSRERCRVGQELDMMFC
jgi:hypothetical protein